MLTSAVKVLECRECEKVCHSQCMGFSVLVLSLTHTRAKLIVPEGHLHTESIGALLVLTACKMVKLFKFLHSPSQRDRTITKKVTV